MLRATACGVFLMLATVIGRAADAKKEQAADAAHAKGLAKAAELFDRVRAAEKAKKGGEVKTLLAEYVAAVQAVAGKLPEVKPEEAARPKAYQKLTLNAAGKRIDGFRFRTPDGKGDWNLDWEFVYPKGTGALTWGIAAREGTVEGFKRFATKDHYVEKGADLPKENRRITQQLHGGKLKSDAEYVIWFAFDGDKPVDVHVRVGLTPVKK